MSRPAQLPVITLRRNLVRAIRQGHPWLYAEALDASGWSEGDGSAVDVRDGGGRFIARGLYDAQSAIAVRIWTLDDRESLDAALIHQRLTSAWNLRQELLDLSDTDAFRLVHGEGDRMPGLICDVYDDTAVLQLDTPALMPWLETIATSVQRVIPGLRRVVLKPTSRLRDVGTPEELTTLAGTPLARPLVISEHGLRFEADPLRGQKTGLYLDQRENRHLVHGLSAGRRVLNLFAYSGGFSVAAAAGGASRVVSVDSAAPAIAAMERNFRLNGLSTAPHAFVAADAFEYLGAAEEQFDLIVLDPPSMASSAANLERAVAAYVRLNRLALGLAAPEALFLTASCSSHVSEDHLTGILRDAATQAGRNVRVVEVRGAGRDHPVLPAFPEGRYLNVLLAYVD